MQNSESSKLLLEVAPGWSLTECLLQGALANLWPLRVLQVQLTPSWGDMGMSQASTEQKLAQWSAAAELERSTGLAPYRCTTAASASLYILSVGECMEGGRTNWNSILQFCTNKLMNDNGLLIEGTGAIHSADCGATNGVLRVAMATGTERLWRSPDLSWSQILFYTCSP